MAKSLDQLMCFLLEEIALDGDDGVTVRDIIGYVKKFYAPQDHPLVSSSSSTAATNVAYDRSLIAKVWEWLAQHEDVFIGDDDKYRRLTLDQLERRFPGIVDNLSDTHGVESSINNRDSLREPSLTASDPAHQTNTDEPRLTVSTERIYHAICGHGPNSPAVFKSWWALLGAIARTRYDGILQGELGRIVGQDKRSVPKRTDALQEKGYIVKKTVYAGGHQTSRLFLRRFAEPPKITESNQTPSFSLKDLSFRILLIIRERTFTTQDDLASTLGMKDSAQQTVLNQLVAHLVRQKILKKIRAAFGPDSAAGDLKICLQLVREPIDADWQDVKTGATNFSYDLEVEDAIAVARTEIGNSTESIQEAPPDVESPLEASSTITNRPQWNPDRLLPNVLFDFAATCGTRGMTNNSARQQITGLTVRRPMESLLVRLSHSSLKVHPPETRELALIRSSEVEEGISRYVHRTFDAYNSLVQQGQTTWSHLPGGNEVKKQLDILKHDPFNTGIANDEFGFAKKVHSKSQLQNGTAMPGDIAINVRASNMTLRPNEVTIFENLTGAFSLGSTTDSGIKSGQASSASAVRNRVAHTRPNNQTGSPRPGYGRPRKFAKGTEKFWQTILKDHKLLNDRTIHQDAEQQSTPREFDAQALHTNRPAGFDEILIKALQQNLPVPATSDNIGEAWMAKMESFFKRQASGVYYVPTGMPNNQRGKRSCVVVFRLTSLKSSDVDKSKLARADMARQVQGSPFEGQIQRSSKITESSVIVPSLPPESPSLIRNLPIDTSSLSSPARQVLLREPESTATSNLRLTRSTKRRRKSVESDAQSEVDDSHATTSKSRPTQKKRMIEKPDSGEVLAVSSSQPDPDGGPVPAEISNRRSLRNRKLSQKAVESFQTPAEEQNFVNHTSPVSPQSSLATETQRINLAGELPDHEIIQSLLEENPFHNETLDGKSATLTQALVTKSIDFSNVLHRHVQDQEILPTETISTHDKYDGAVVRPTTTDFSNDEPEVQENNQQLSQDMAIERPNEPVSTELSLHDPSVHVNTTAITSQEYSSAMNSNSNGFSQNLKPTTTKNSAAVAEDDTTSISATADADNGINQISSSNANSDAPNVNQPPLTPFTSTPEFLSGRDAVQFYRKTLLDLVHMCGGVVPHDPPLMKRAMKTRCIEQNIDSEPNIKLMKSQIGDLVKRGKIKVMQFAFQRNGFNHTKSVIALPSVKVTDSVFLEVQRKITSLPVEDDYVPPELAAETTRKPSANVNRDSTLENSAKLASARRMKSKKPPLQDSRSVTPTRTQRLSMSLNLPVLSSNTGFLTLKVSRIAQIKPSTLFTNRHFSRHDESGEQESVDVGEDAVGYVQNTPVSRQTSGNFSSRNTRNDRSSRNIQWRASRGIVLPKSLKAILAQEPEASESADIDDSNPGLTAFARVVDRVASWETQHWENLQEPKRNDWNFINHLVKKGAVPYTLPRDNSVWYLVRFDKDPKDSDSMVEIETCLPYAESWIIFARLIQEMERKKNKITGARVQRRRKTQEADYMEGEDEEDHEHDRSDFVVSDDDMARSKRIRRQTKTTTTATARKRKAGTEGDQRHRKRARHEPRGVGMRHLSKEVAHRVSVAFVVAKVLAGGLENYLNFTLVNRLIPEETEALLKERWKVLSTRYNNDIDTYVQDMQIKYLDALLADKVPSVNYSDLDGTNWEGILDWAVANLSTESKDTSLEISSSREEFMTLNKIEVEEPNSVRNLFNQSMSFTQTSREEAWCSVITGVSVSQLPQPGGVTLEPSFATETEELDPNLLRARSWILAAVLTPQDSYNATTAHQKLLKLAPTESALEPILDRTMKRLQADKIIVKQESSDAATTVSGQVYSGTHGWKINSRWFDRFIANRTITSSMLRDAARYKRYVLDPAFTSGQSVLLPKDPQIVDGAMVAIFNLLSMGMLQILPGHDVPASRYGLDWEGQGYKTRSMDKDILSFSTILEPTHSYAPGDNVASLRTTIPIPKGTMNQSDGLGLIPAWFDITPNFQPAIWEMILGAIVGIISVRPGVSSGEIVRTLMWALGRADVEMILEYAQTCGLVTRAGKEGWETEEWWWLAVGVGSESASESSVYWAV